MVLNGGDQPSGIYGYIDLFTWQGWIKMYLIGWVVKLTRNYIEAIIIRSLFILLYLFNNDMVLCYPGEKLPIFFGLVNGCNFTYNISEGNIMSRIENFLSEAILDFTTDFSFGFI